MSGQLNTASTSPGPGSRETRQAGPGWMAGERLYFPGAAQTLPAPDTARPPDLLKRGSPGVVRCANGLLTDPLARGETRHDDQPPWMCESPYSACDSRTEHYQSIRGSSVLKSPLGHSQRPGQAASCTPTATAGSASACGRGWCAVPGDSAGRQGRRAGNPSVRDLGKRGRAHPCQRRRTGGRQQRI